MITQDGWIQGVPQNMIVGKQFRMSSSIISCLIPKTIIKLIYRSHIIINFKVKYILKKDFLIK